MSLVPLLGSSQWYLLFGFHCLDTPTCSHVVTHRLWCRRYDVQTSVVVGQGSEALASYTDDRGYVVAERVIYSHNPTKVSPKTRGRTTVFRGAPRVRSAHGGPASWAQSRSERWQMPNELPRPVRTWVTGFWLRGYRAGAVGSPL